MEVKLLPGDENSYSVFNLNMRNHENVIRKTPSRAFKKIPATNNNNTSYFTEVMIQIRNGELSDGPNYYKFDHNIETRIKKKEVANNINIISFYGDNNTDINNIVNFKDIELLSNFQALFNDHIITLPYSLSLYKCQSDNILSYVKSASDSFFSVLNSKTNIFGYLPLYISYREIEKFLTFYANKFNLSVSYNGGSYNAIPLMIDFKRTSPDTFMRSVAYLYELKRKYLNDGFYPLYYAANVSMPRSSIKKTTALAKEFMLSFLGFDIIGNSQAIHLPQNPRFGGVRPKSISFDQQSFNYIFDNNQTSKYNKDAIKSQIFETQTTYLNKIHDETLNNNKYVELELNKRKVANKYINTLKGE
ncbi:hypothetical protein [Ferroplasma acidiphilum]|jgi:hypothetical protein|uniref:hypothetical protein n=1 Tax=Ferroplasma acidiphilum TaxID=74969 RepID=UPI002814D15B|nr:hypothetical protein [Ferroplasma acidiphilum]WMT53773.1 MAG: hypothetical protein RE473_02740 [Ferroplasma acidiphilum]